MYQFYRTIIYKHCKLLKYSKITNAQYNYSVSSSSHTNLVENDLFYNLKIIERAKSTKLYLYHVFNQKNFSKLFSTKPLISKNLLSVRKTRKSILLIDNENNIKELESLLKNPKQVLNNFYANISLNVFPDQKKKLTVQYKLINQGNESKLWNSSYKIFWPEEIKFEAIGRTKKEASDNAAVDILKFLYEKGKISKEGTPIIYDKAEIQNIINRSYISFNLKQEEKNKLKEINDIFENISTVIDLGSIAKVNFSELDNDDTLVKILDNDFYDNEKVREEILQKYYAKEPVTLPVQKYKDQFLNLLDNNQIIIIKGETGCGKSTRIPQYLLEHYVKTNNSTNALIMVTQPRRVAAISLAERVAQEREENTGHTVGFKVRFNVNFNKKTGRILYCTTGILLREIQGDPNLKNYSHIVLDEAHERDVNTDLLMNLIRQTLIKNPKLKLIIMSATLDVGLFEKYYNNPPVLHIPGFSYPVKQHFLEDINLDLSSSKKLWNSFDCGKGMIDYYDIVKVIDWIHSTKTQGAILCFLPGWEDISKVKKLLLQKLESDTYIILSVHSKLSNAEQKKIFGKYPGGVRKIILSTNIAETSLTINDVVYVVDSGVHKEARFNANKGMICLDNHRICQSNVNQRKGRAGRVQSGESFHIFPKKSYDEMEQYSVPQILQTPLSKIVLDAKVYSRNMNSIDFFSHLPTPPREENVRQAVKQLQELEMLDSDENLTELGLIASDFQLDPKLSKVLIHSLIYKCVTPLTDIVAIFSYDMQMFSTALTDKNQVIEIKKKFSKDSDHISLMIIFEKWISLLSSYDFQKLNSYCTEYNLIPQKLNMLKKLKEHYYNEYLHKRFQQVLELSDDFSGNKELLLGVILSGSGTVLFQKPYVNKTGRLKNIKLFITRHNHLAAVLSDSVNYKNLNIDSPFLIHINEVFSSTRNMVLVQDTSVIQPLTYLLFTNSKDVEQNVYDTKYTSIENPVLLKFEGTNCKMYCNIEDLRLINKCKDGLRKAEKYFIHQLTQNNQINEDVLNNWNTILNLLASLLNLKKQN